MAKNNVRVKEQVSPAELLSVSAASGIAGMQAAAGGRVGLRDVGDPAASSDVTKELADTGPALKELLLAMGLGVAESQTALDKTLVATAKALSETKIEVISVVQQKLDDEGKLESTTPITQELPLVNYIMPTVYAFTSARLKVDSHVSEFNTANGFKVQGKSQSFSAGLNASYSRRAGFGISGSASYGYSDYSASGASSYGSDYAAGNVQMEVLLEPRQVTLPTPVMAVNGPTLSLAVERIANLKQDGTETTDASLATGRRVIVRAEARKEGGAKNDGKTLAITSSNNSITIATFDAAGQAAVATSATDGTLRIWLDRNGTAADPVKTLETNLRVCLGLVCQTIAISA